MLTSRRSWGGGGGGGGMLPKEIFEKLGAVRSLLRSCFGYNAIIESPHL